MTEDLHTTSAAVVDPPTSTETVDDGGDGKPSSINIEEREKKKKRGSFNIFKAALFMMRKSSSNKKKKQQQQQQIQESSQHIEDQVPNSKGDRNWKKIVGSIRPLHIPDNQTPTTLSPSTTVDNFEDLLHHASSSSSSFPSPSVYDCASSTTGTMSQYASAANLQELDDNNSDNEDDNDQVFDAIPGDEMIDAKAEEFIAQFYLQMRLQQI